MKFCFLTINHQRPSIFRLFCASIDRLRIQLGIDFPVVCVSEAEDRIICEEHNVYHIEYPNIPVSEKWNVGTEFIKTLDIDYMVVTGSDDIFSTNCLYNITKEMSHTTDLIGLNQIYVYDTDGVNRGQLLCVSSKGILGVGRTIHRRVLEAVNWRPWDYPAPRNWGMDAIMYKNISPHVETRAIVDGIVVDCKSKKNLNKFTMLKSNYHGKPVDKNLFYNFLSKEELKILNGITHVGLPISFPRQTRKRGRTLL